MTREELEQHLITHEWTQDRWGHFKKLTPDGSTYRMKLQARVVRLEKQVTMTGSEYTKDRKEWVRVRSATYKQLSISANDKLAGFTK